MKLTRDQFDHLCEYAFSGENPGFKPTVVESPNGDGVWDAEKQYAHIAPKYFHAGTPLVVRIRYLCIAVYAARVLEDLCLPPDLAVGPDSTLRLLRYPPGATTAPHTDFDLLTLSLYRSDEAAFKYLSGEEHPFLQKARTISPGSHFGEILTEITGVEATRHETVPLETRSVSAVFFVIPPHEYVLPSGLTVGQWLAERIARSRK
jgi:hypothetical protein